MKTGINFLKFALDKDNKRPMLFDTAEMLQMEIMDEFSKWLADSNYKLMYNLSACWVNQKTSEIKNMSELYQIYLKSREA